MISAKKAKFEGTIQPWGNSLGLEKGDGGIKI